MLRDLTRTVFHLEVDSEVPEEVVITLLQEEMIIEELLEMVREQNKERDAPILPEKVVREDQDKQEVLQDTPTMFSEETEVAKEVVTIITLDF